MNALPLGCALLVLILGCSRAPDGSKSTTAQASASAAAPKETLATRLPACAACEASAKLCENFRPCDRFGDQVDSQKRRKADTCREVLECVVRTGCAAVGVEGDCYCGNISAEQCNQGKGIGACKAEIERGADSTDPAVVQSTFTATRNGGGMAFARVVCLNGSSCQQACAGLSPKQ